MDMTNNQPKWRRRKTDLEQPHFPVELGGTAQDAPGVSFAPTTQLQRPGLLLLNGVVYAGFGGHCDTRPWRGWVFGVSTQTGQVTTRWVDNETAEGGGIWQSGNGPASDGAGYIYLATGNGSTDVGTNIVNRSASLRASANTCWARGVKLFIIGFPMPGPLSHPPTTYFYLV